MDRRVAPAVVAVLLAIAAALFPPSRPQSAGAVSAGKLFFAMQIADEQGAVVAQPKLLGMCGVPLEMRLADPDNLASPRMSLRLLPDRQRDGSYEIAFELSVPGRMDKGKGTIQVFPGEEKSTRVDYPGGHFDVQLAAFAVPSAELQLYLEHGVQLHQRPQRT